MITTFKQLDNPATADPEELLLNYLVEREAYQLTHPAESRDIAYDIAGLLATRFASTLSDENPYAQLQDKHSWVS